MLLLYMELHMSTGVQQMHSTQNPPTLPLYPSANRYVGDIMQIGSFGEYIMQEEVSQIH